MKVFTLQQVLQMHQQLSDATGGSPELRDIGLLESAVSTPFQSFGGFEACPTLEEKAARLGFGLIRNHPFVDGNKRIGAHCMLMLLIINGVSPRYTQTELSDIILETAAGKSGYDALLDWIRSHTR